MNYKKIKVKHKCITEQGRIRTISHTYSFPPFEDIAIKSGHSVIPKEVQQMDWLDEQDKSDWMQENEVSVIIDYWIQKEKKRKASFQEYAAQVLNGQEEDLVIDFFAAYAKMRTYLKGLSAEKKMKVVLESLSLGYDAASAVLSRLKDVSDSYKEGLAEKKSESLNSLEEVQRLDRFPTVFIDSIK